jgi:hypothetical protein
MWLLLLVIAALCIQPVMAAAAAQCCGLNSFCHGCCAYYESDWRSAFFTTQDLQYVLLPAERISSIPRGDNGTIDTELWLVGAVGIPRCGGTGSSKAGVVSVHLGGQFEQQAGQQFLLRQQLTARNSRSPAPMTTSAVSAAAELAPADAAQSQSTTALQLLLLLHVPDPVIVLPPKSNHSL